MIKTLEILEDLLENKTTEIENWFQTQWQGKIPLPYFSCDVRHSSYKMGIVDTNLFPGGFNNLCHTYTTKTTELFDEYFSTYYSNAKNILLLGENHTRNKFYLLNLLKIQSFIKATGRNCTITIPLEQWPQKEFSIPLTETDTILIQKTFTQDQKLHINNQEVDLILTNNDFSAGLPKEYENYKDIIIPFYKLGWYNRLKSEHFKHLKTTIDEFATKFSIDPWLLQPISKAVKNVSSNNLEELAKEADSLIQDIQKKYNEYNIQETPYVFIKNDSGTYGLGITSVNSGEEVLQMNRKKRNKLFSSKSKNQIDQFILQEGIPTTDNYSGHPIEPVIYGVGKEPAGGFFRIHEKKSPFDSLNSPGMSFSCLCLHKLDEPHEQNFIDCKQKKLLVKAANLLARFAALAVTKEKLALI